MTNSNGDPTHRHGLESTAARFAPQELVAGRYRIVRLIGSGGIGQVYEAFDNSLGATIALKTLRPSNVGDAVQLERFRREIQSARKVTHFNVCRIFDMGVHTLDRSQQPFLTMELLVGETLAHRLEQGRVYDTDEALPVAVQIADGLQAAHEAGVIHRDLKPGNIMLLAAPTGKFSPRAVITDFGTALSDEQGGIRLTQSGELIGTPEYMAPEQIDQSPVRPATDIYALGLILYEMLSGRRPFDDGSKGLTTVLKRRREPAPPLRRLVPKIDPVWESTIARCLERDPARRFQTAEAVAAALQGAAQGGGGSRGTPKKP